MVAAMEHPSREWLGELIGNLYQTPTEVVITFISPAQGALFAPLASGFVQSEPFIFFFLVPD